MAIETMAVEPPETPASLLNGTETAPNDTMLQLQPPPITPESTVQEQLTSVLSSGSPLLRLADSRSKEEAQRKGLLSSSLAVGAGQKAVLDTALPIAQQDANTFAERGLLNQRGLQDIALTRERGKIESGLVAQEGDIASALSTQNAGQALAQIEKEAALTGDLEKAARAWQSDHSTLENQWSQERLTRTHEFELATLDAVNELSTAERQDKHAKALEILNATSDNQIQNTTLQGAINAFITASELDQRTGTNYADGIMKIMSFPDSEVSASVKTQMTNNWRDMYTDIGNFSNAVSDKIFGLGA